MRAGDRRVHRTAYHPDRDPEPWRLRGVHPPGGRPRAPRAMHAGDPWAAPPSIEGSAAVRLRGMTKSFTLRSRFGNTVMIDALRGVDLEVARGEAVALVGESGSGKTTLLRIVAGLGAPGRWRRWTSAAPAPQMIFQNALASLTPWLTVRELVGERLSGRGLRGGDRPCSRSARCCVSDSRRGWRGPRRGSSPAARAQRVAIARAIVNPPRAPRGRAHQLARHLAARRNTQPPRIGCGAISASPWCS